MDTAHAKHTSKLRLKTLREETTCKT